MTGTVLAHTETRGTKMKEALTEASMGSNIEELKKSLADLLKDHTQWVATAGQNGVRLDLSGYDLRSIQDLRKYSLTAVKAVGANFLNQDLTGANIQSAILDKSDFRDCKMKSIDLRGTSIRNALLTRADLSGANMSPLQFNTADGNTWMQRVNMSGSNMRYSVLRGADLRDAVLMGTDLSYAILIDCDLRRADLTGANLDGADLAGALLSGTIIDEKYRSAAKA
jgi:uncharacterized protein YjbI with pentapeptide repeats